MSNGISLIIPGASFSGSPLGKVTFVKSPEEVVTEYITKVGAPLDKKDALVTLYSRLLEIGVVNTLDVFPMLGGSLNDRLVGLKSEGSEYLFNSLLAGDNASMNSGGGISFDDADANFTGEEEGYVEKSITDISDGFFYFIRLSTKRIGIGKTGYYLLGPSKTSGQYYVQLETQQGADTNYHEALVVRFTGKTETTDTSVLNKMHLDTPSSYFAHYEHTNGGMKLYFGNDVENYYTCAPLNYLPTPIWINNLIGGIVDNSDTHFFNADVEMLAVGVVPNDKFQDVCDAFIEYFS